MNDSKFTPQPTKDGSYTFFSQEFQETFHSSFGAKQEAEVKYIEPCAIASLAAQKSTIRLLDVCYGLGYNSAAALETIWSINPSCSVELLALELTANVPKAAVEHNLLAQWQVSNASQTAVYKLLAELSNKSLVQNEFLDARLLLGDARQTVKAVAESDWYAEAIFLDPFSPPKCPQLWTVEFITLLTQCLAPTGRLATYSCSAAVRTALLTTGLNIASIWGAGRKSPGTIAGFEYKKILSLSKKEREHLATRAAIPYRDPDLQDRPEQIIARRQQEQQNSTMETASKWRKRWLESYI